MVRQKPEPIENPPPLPPPAKTLEGREEQLIAAAMNLIEVRINDGTATAQETIHFARQGSVETKMKLKSLEAQNDLLRSRIKELESKTTGEAMYAAALAAFKGYAGLEPVDPESDEYDEDPDLYGPE